ncbi:hypothetical protein O181_115531, partial [Austropuccinia psidii MF-1]|nr:hypothetical protein [Austropuccinia psidii MF-1]
FPQQASPCVGAQELTIPRQGVLSQPCKLPSWTPYGISVPYQSFGTLAISIITGQISLSSFLAFYGHFTPGANLAPSLSSGLSRPFSSFGHFQVFSSKQGKYSPKFCIWPFNL